MDVVLYAGITTAATDDLFDPGFNGEDCRQILKAMRPAPKQDRFAADAIQASFLDEVLTGRDMSVGKARAGATAALIAMSNVRRPLCYVDNSYSLRLAQDGNDMGKPYDLIPLISCSWRAKCDLTRILLASRVYRASHGGRLPASTDGFVPTLGAWPIDPFDGKPFKYLPRQEKVYGVREDLIDHGGDVGTGYPSGKDAGFSLRLR